MFRTCGDERFSKFFCHTCGLYCIDPRLCYHGEVKKWAPILAFGFVLALLGNILFAYNAFERTRVVAVPDGDSLDLADGRRIRLLGIDAPEKGRCMADEARDKLVQLAQRRHVRLKEIVKDSFGRQLAIVIVEDWPAWIGYMQKRFDPLLQRSLLSSGLARYESSVSSQYHQVLKDAQEAAKASKLGIWSDECRGQTSPEADCTIKGNIRAGKKTYFLPDCPNYSDVIIDRAFGDAWLCSEGEATNAGFTKAGSCH